MDLYLIRHAEAFPLGEQGITDDAARPLTPHGIEQARLVAEGLQRKGVRVEILVSSPLVRARQTAEEMVRTWAAPALDIHVTRHLAPNGKRRKLAVALAALRKDVLALIGHEPDLGQFAAWLVGSRKVQIKFGKGGVAYLQSDGMPDKGSCTLEWLVTQEWLADGGSARDQGASGL